MPLLSSAVPSQPRWASNRIYRRASALVLLSTLLQYPTTSLGLEAPALALSRRAVQSEAVCLDSFDWMDNSAKQSPCTVAAYLLAQCTNGNWDVAAIPDANHHYTPPNATNANGCSCSWAVYNTLQACADCQGENFETAMLTWSGYNQNCTGTLLSDTDYYPPNTPIPDDTAIPFWATTNPSTWTDGIFDPSTAQNLANEDKPDITQTSREAASKKGPNKGAIAGGVVGGVVALLLFAVIFYYLRRRRAHGRGLKSRSSVRFTSPLFPWRTGSSARTLTSAAGMGGAGGKYAGQTASAFGYNNLTPSPGPTLPVSMALTGNSSGSGRPPYNTMPSSTSFMSSGTASPPLGDFTMNPAQPGKTNNNDNYNYGYDRGLLGILNNNSGNRSNPNFSVSSAYATVAHSTSLSGTGTGAAAASAVARNSHAHTLSGDSAVFSMQSQSPEPPEGTIVPFVLPPVLPEPMGADGATRAASPGSGGKGGTQGHGRGPSDSSATSGNANANANAVAGAGAGAGGTRRERLNPPAYTPTSDPLPLSSPPGIDPAPTNEDAEGGGEVAAEDFLSMSGSGSNDAQRAETTLSGTTLMNQSSSGRAATTVADEQNGNGTRRDEGERGRGAHGFPVDRKS